MDGPGEYVPDVTEGITCVDDLPEPKTRRRSRNYKKRPCPHCGYAAYRDKVYARKLHDLGDVAANRPVDLWVTYSQHYCSKCRTYFNADLFTHRCLFVKHALTPKEKRLLQRITRGFPALRTLRSMMDQVYGLFDRRCRTDTALAKLAQLRRRVRRFKRLGETLKKLFTPTLEKALTFLDDSLLPSTSNAVERGNRRHRKMQRTVYRVRTRAHISQRIAVDMQRDEQAERRLQTTPVLHSERK